MMREYKVYDPFTEQFYARVYQLLYVNFYAGVPLSQVIVVSKVFQ